MVEIDEMDAAFAQVRAGLAAIRTLVDGADSWPQRELLGRQRELFSIRREMDLETSRVVAETARRSDDSDGVGLARGQGHRTVESLVASVSGGSTAEAGRQARVGRVLDDAVRARAHADDAAAGLGFDDEGSGAVEPGGPVFPVVAQALVEMRLSIEAGDVVICALRRVADVLEGPELATFEAELVAKAMGLPLAQVKRMVAGAEARLKPDEVKKRENQARKDRFATIKSRPDGTWLLTAVMDPASMAPIKAFLDAYARAGFHAQRGDKGADGSGTGEGGLGGAERRSAAQMRADALVALARHGAGCEAGHAGVKTTVIVRLSLEDLRAGEGVAEIDGHDTPVSVATARQLAADAEIIPCVLGGDGEVLDWGRTRRLFTKAQSRYLVERDGGCAKCHAPPDWCEAHHIQWWNRGGPTDIANGVLLCTACHHDLHRDGWDIDTHDNQVWLIPPRHIDPTRTPRLGGRAAVELAA
ncbi:HNH endonuclease signature motif containing protein [Demequina sp. NBRC 110054]|uniref:HNH endonuclease n=1 Tax=Demequina sp. NBRC 110054 TaxID=1570343 RepID=UPI000A02DB4D|nr:HNH endonuclease signature motif containing protein [Demequina sp. NBRC 110054]